jgi:hypothetical protein
MLKFGGRWRLLALLAAGVAFVTACAFAWLYFADAPRVRLDNGDKRASIGALILTIVGLILSASMVWHGRRPPPFEHRRLLLDAEEELSELVAEQWDREAQVRGLASATPLRVRWSSTGLNVGAPAAEVLGSSWTAGRATRLKLHGNATAIAEALRQLPARRLVIIGSPGAGKTSLAVLLVRALLAVRVPEEPVPTLLTLSMWEPEKLSLEKWLIKQIAGSYPQLTSRDHFGPDAVARLLSGGRILPVLDGLDELPAGVRGRAISRINNYVTRDRPIVITCRSEEYQEIIQQVGVALVRAAVVELQPVTSVEAADYLPTGQGDGSSKRWEPVTRYLHRYPDSPLADVFSTPLMVHLARVVYSVPQTVPSDLLQFDEPAQVRKHLLENYVAAVYAAQDAPEPQPSNGRYSASQAEKWLSFLAAHMSKFESRELTWWQLINTVPYRRMLNVSYASLVVAFLIEMVGFGGEVSIQTLTVSCISGAILGPLLGLLIGLADGLPRRVRITPRRFFDGFLIGSVFTLATTPLAVLGAFVNNEDGWDSALLQAAILQAIFCLVGGIFVGISAFLIDGLSVVSANDQHESSRSLWKKDRQVLVVTMAAAVLAAGFVVLTGCFAVSLFFADRSAALRQSADISVRFALIIGVIVTLGSGAGSAWLNFNFARFWQAIRGRAPWRVLEFLDNAHDRGVLRKIGTVYQFRHSRLQETLTELNRKRWI